MSHFDPGGPNVLSYSPLDPSFTDLIPTGVYGIFQSVKILSITSFGRELDLRHVKEPEAEIRASAKFVGIFTLAVERDANDLRCYERRKTQNYFCYCIAVLVFRFLGCFQRCLECRGTQSQVVDLDRAKIYWCKVAQASEFS